MEANKPLEMWQKFKYLAMKVLQIRCRNLSNFTELEEKLEGS
jgi:hypothetical protein